MAESNASSLPKGGDYHRAKRDLLRRGITRGRLTISEIRAALPAPHFSAAEMELFLFSLDALGVEVVDDVSEDAE